MRKLDKKLEKRIVAALNDACESALETYEGFQWLTHLVNYQSFPESLSIICVFDTQENLNKTTETDVVGEFKDRIEARLLLHDINVKDIKRRILFDTEEACNIEHGGSWNKRLKGLGNARHA